MKRVLGVALGLLVATRAAAEVRPVTSRGEAPAAARDPRTAAIDDALAAAVTEVVRSEAGSEATADPAVRQQVLARARRYVASFKVARDEAVDERRVLEVVAQVDVAKVTAELVRLGVLAAPTPAVLPRAARTATVLLRVVTPDGAAASFGAAAARELAGYESLAEALRARGLTVRPAPAAGPSPRGEGPLPIDLASARAFAGDARADIAIVAQVEVTAAEPVRGSPEAGALARAQVAWLDVATSQALSPSAATAGAAGSAAGLGEQAATRALLAAFGDAAPKATSGPPAGPRAAAAADEGEVLVELRGAGWAQAVAVAGALGKGKVGTLRRLGQGGAVLAVRGATDANAVAAAVRAAGWRGAQVDGDRVVAEAP